MRSLLWLRRDLRTIDNTALIAAINATCQESEGAQGLMALFIVTPEQWHQHGLSPIQAQLIERRLQALSSEFQALRISLRIEVAESYKLCPDIIARLCKRYNIGHVFANQEYEINELNRDKAVMSITQTLGVEFCVFADKCVQSPGQVLNQKGLYFKVFTPFKNTWLKSFNRLFIAVAQPKPLPSNDLFDDVEVSIDLSAYYPTEGAKKVTPYWHSTSKAILEQLRAFTGSKAQDYQHHRDFPALQGTSQLSAYLSLGMLSARQCIASLLDGQDVHQLNQGQQTWLNELIWREFYQHLIYFEPKLCQGACFVPWGKHLQWLGNPQHFELWQQGKTGYPLVDAAMRQLNQTGWMHNRLRMVVASFFTKDLLLDWRKGEAYFMSKLVDGDFAANNGGWQWAASTGCDAQPYFRIFNPVTQGQKFDPQGDFVKRWLPELNPVPRKYIHCPWLWADFASLNYPNPIVEHKQQRVKALRMYKEAKDRGS
ncbi:deoxyribodipyrimidine photo-lyase [Vibrio rarus]|uniref:deoxyribodipyrimidine photo-lyase n=1 Tax=Vibrio rarus TaxID=413403 RepID=UPI0021C302DF|nr:deoxyribodipyrimidine photo-lyase [Vibrio rarus]